MEIELIRTNETKWGVDGMLRVKGEKFCDTVEHPTKHKPKGRYEVTLADNPFRHGDGPMLLNFGEIIVGENACPGLVIRSAAAYATLYDRLKKEWKRGNEVVLKIR